MREGVDELAWDRRDEEPPPLGVVVTVEAAAVVEESSDMRSPSGWRIWEARSHHPQGKRSRELIGAQNCEESDQPSKLMRMRSCLSSRTVAGQMSCGFLGSTASSLSPIWNSFLLGRAGPGRKHDAGANWSDGVVSISLCMNRCQRLSSKPKPNGGEMWRPLSKILSNF